MGAARLKKFALGVLGLTVVAGSGCATTRPTTRVETVITDSVTYRQAQRMVAVSVPGDSAKLTTRLVYDEATHRFQPVTLYSRSGNILTAFTLDANGLVTATAVTVPFVAQVPVTDTEITRAKTADTTTTTVVEKKRPLGGFARFCIGFTVLVFVGAGLWVYIRFFTPIRFLR